MTPVSPEPRPKRIQRKRTKGWKMPANTVYVGRPTKWGNPFVVSTDHDRLDYYGAYSENHDLWDGWPVVNRATAVIAFQVMKALHLDREELRAELRGKDLACWCPLDQPCHADVLLEIANTESEVSR